MFRPLSMIFAAGVALLGATAAHAGTHWSVGINLPVPGVVVTNGGYYVSEPVPECLRGEQSPQGREEHEPNKMPPSL